MEAAQIRGQVNLTFLHEQEVLKRRPLPLTLTYQSSSRYNEPHAIAVTAAGKSARNDQCGVILSMPPVEVEKFRAFMTANPLFEMNPPKKAEVNLPLPEPDNVQPEFDSDSIALFLDALRDAGGSVTRATANITAARLFNGQTAILQAVIHQGYVTLNGEVCQISDKGTTLLGVAMETTQPIAPTMDRFEELRQAVKSSRQRLEEIRVVHDQTATARTKLTRDMEDAKRLLSDSEKSVTAAKERLTTAESQQRLRRAEVLRVEEELRKLPANDGHLAAAQRELEAAEAAYKKFVEI